jgi:hypothetical protein
LVLGQHRAVGTDENRAERFVTGLQRIGRELHTAPQIHQFGRIHHGRTPLLTDRSSALREGTLVNFVAMAND